MTNCKHPRISESFGRPKGGTGGFTLIELMITITVLAILVAIGVPGIRTILDSLSGNRAVNEIVSELHNARMLAIRYGRPSQVGFDTATNQYTLKWKDTTGDQTRVSDFQRFRGGVKFEPNPPGLGGPSPVLAAGIVFSPQGFATTPGDIYITDQDNSKVIRIQIAYSGAISEMRWVAASNQWTYD